MAEKTEKPTEKKRRDAAKKGQTVKSRDSVALAVIVAGVTSAPACFDLMRVLRPVATVMSAERMPNPGDYLLACGRLFLTMTLPFVLICTLAGVVPALLQSRFALATDAIRIDFAALNPVNGIKKLFSLRSLKELVKAIFYLAITVVVAWLYLDRYGSTLIASRYADGLSLGHVWSTLLSRLVLLFVVCALPVLVLDVLVEYLLHGRDLKMDRHEVKQEHKQTEGNQEIKGRLRELREELLSEEIKRNIEQSTFILANPTHIAIGIYLNPDIVPLPFVSVRETNARARAVLRHAKAKGVPIVRAIALARSVYKRSPRRYSFVSLDDLDGVMRVLVWLREIEAANRFPDEPVQQESDFDQIECQEESGAATKE
ncbi:EscU/YscU/HrcU family type III secretion system export apparatus switch protein [Burkholderia dolosa]|uniref:EscU/YscU/HrcU family type III secretion system export apparatus switch protein n=1 Tax=Burkholderia dolosa TaxID=152500 RepID=UPI0015906116|nr:EscU/YscU/HrcU family type III secretion system export apparatus switch protein [Burkholderia dolosa]MBR8458400.1 EscU/YscU/HrcU family type III secretion system export apparatus switch protein [Burkholderia dolosa]